MMGARQTMNDIIRRVLRPLPRECRNCKIETSEPGGLCWWCQRELGGE